MQIIAQALGAPIAIAMGLFFVGLYYGTATSPLWGFPAGYVLGKRSKGKILAVVSIAVGVVGFMSAGQTAEWEGVQWAGPLSLVGLCVLGLGFVFGRRAAGR